MCFLKEKKIRGNPIDAFLKEKEEEKIGKKSESNSQTSKQGEYSVKHHNDEAKLGAVF